MRKLIFLFLLIPTLSQAGFHPETGIQHSVFFGNKANNFLMVQPNALTKSKLPKAFYPWGAAAAGVLVGGGLAYYGSYKDNYPLSVTGGIIAIAGGTLAVLSLSPLRKYIGLAGMNKKSMNTSLALNPVGMYLSIRF